MFLWKCLEEDEMLQLGWFLKLPSRRSLYNNEKAFFIFVLFHYLDLCCALFSAAFLVLQF